MTPEAFVVAWSKAKCIQDVADALNMPKSSVKHRANFYRKKGVRLQLFKPPRKKIDVRKLNNLGK